MKLRTNTLCSVVLMAALYLFVDRILAAPTSVLPPQAAVGKQLDLTELNAILARQAASWEKHDFAIGASDWLPDGVLTSPGGQVKVAQMQAVITDYAQHFRDLRVKVNHVFLSADGSEAAIEWDWEVTRVRDGKHGITHDAILVTFDGNKIKSWREYFDLGDSVDANP
jgi:ketosteroid isomerase-like protein